MEFMNPRIIIREALCVDRSHTANFIVTLKGAVEYQSDSTRYAVDTTIKEWACAGKWDVRRVLRYLEANMSGRKPQIIWQKRRRRDDRSWWNRVFRRN